MSKISGHERGYVLLTLLLMVAVIMIAAAAILPTVAFEIRRDREEELVHRGVQYSRAIRSYYKKLGRYPTRLEELESTNNLRFLRKRYKDPITGGDFKLLHFGEVKMTFSAPLAGASNLNGAAPASTPGGFGTQQGIAPAGGGFGTSPTGFATAKGPSSDDANPKPDQGQPADSGSPPQNPGDQQGQQAKSPDALAGQTFGGGPIVGVVSTSKKDSIREFNHKKKYNEWQFIYDPSMDRGGLLNTPNQPQLQGFGNAPIQQVSPNGALGSQPGPQNSPNAPGPGTPPPMNNQADQH
jgi:type II secretory pathway pseudopilin PulG